MTAHNRKIQVLVVEDSSIARELLTRILAADPDICVAGYAKDGEEALAALKRFTPDVITMDIHMPGIDGYETTRRIMETVPVPIIIVSASYDAEDVTKAFRAMEAGAVAVVDKPPGPTAPNHEKLAHKLVQMVKAMAEVRVVKRWAHARQTIRGTGAPSLLWSETSAVPTAIQLVAIGASTGGPPVLQRILEGLPKPFPVPILIVQHISAGFVEGLATWLTQRCGLLVCVARDGERMVAGQAHIAPDGVHMRVSSGGWLICAPDPPVNGLRPAVSQLFRSVADVYGKSAVGILLTGMGRDGADELKLMRGCGAVTIAQDQETSVVHGMPGAAVQIGAAMHVLSPERIVEMLRELVPPSYVFKP
jgi:two-component system chemotaxis response regulator CheB